MYKFPIHEQTTDPQAACLHLRSKGMYVSGSRVPTSGDSNCWCSKTANVIGPDDGLVERHRCDSSRTCFQAII
jgi:hypothetical protein